MSNNVRPFLKAIIPFAPQGKRFSQRHYVQIVKVRQKRGESHHISLTDGEFTVHSMVRSSSAEFETGDILEINDFDVGRQKASSIIVVVLRLYSFEKVGKDANIVGSPKAVQDMESFHDIVGTNKASGSGSVTPPPEKKPRFSAAADTPIEGITPFINTWRARVRAGNKSDIREYHTQRGQGKLFNVTFTDVTGEIRATAFNQQVDEFYDKLVNGQAYTIEGFRVQAANKKFSNVNNDFELMFTRDTKVVHVNDAEDIPRVKFAFVPFSQLLKYGKDSLVDVIGAIHDVSEVQHIIVRTTNNAVPKREVTLVDDSAISVRVTLWGDQAQDFAMTEGEILAVKAAKVSDFDGRSLSVTRMSPMFPNPDDPEAFRLKGWYDVNGRSTSFHSLRDAAKQEAEANGENPDAKPKLELKTVQQVMDEHIGQSDDTEYFSIRAPILMAFSKNFAYPACPSEGCNKKVTEVGSGEWRCEKCDATFESPQWRYILSLSIGDPSNNDGGLMVTAFDREASEIVGKPAVAMMELKENVGMDQQTKLFNFIRGNEYVWRIKARQETFNEQRRTRFQATSVQPINADPAKFASQILDELHY